MDFSKLTAYLDTLGEKYGVPGYDVIITKGHETVFRHMGGHSDYEGRVPMNGTELYYIYSATKVITMVAAMQLIQAGKLGLDDPVAGYLPEFEHMQVADHCDLAKWPPEIPTLKDPHHPARTPITLRMLMTMTAGFNYDTAGEPILKLKKETGNQADTRQMMGAIAQMPLLFDPGTHYSYSLSHDVTAAVVEAVSGLSFGDYLKKNIFEPLGVNEMYFHLPAGLRPRLMAQYGCWPDPDAPSPVPQENSYCLSDRYESGGAGLCCTVEAYCAVMEALANGGVGRSGKQILTPEAIALLTANQLNDAMLAEYRSPWRMDYGYGLGVRTKIVQGTSPAPVGEFGWDGAAGAYGLADPVNHISLFYAQEVLGMMKVYEEVHPRLRDLAYEALLSE